MITSVSNEKIKELIKLNKSKYRSELNLFLVEGDHLVQEAKKLNLLVEVYTTDNSYDGILVSENVMRKICNTNSVCPVVGVVKKINNINITNNVLILDEVRDPGNLGTLLRSAKAFGFDTVFCSNGCVDFYNDKVIRSSQGAIFKLNLINGNIIEFITKLKTTHKIYGTNVVNGISLNEVEASCNFGLVLGNEGSGISSEVFSILEKNIYVEMNDTESLNVGVCGSIIMHYVFNRK